VLLMAGLMWAIWEVRADMLRNEFEVILGATAMAAGVSALAFLASRACLDYDRKRVYFQEGERLFQAAVLLAMTTMLKFIIVRESLLFESSRARLDAVALQSEAIFIALLSIPKALFFLYGIMAMVVAFTRLNRLLYLSANPFQGSET
jgi:hypothetical protein